MAERLESIADAIRRLQENHEGWAAWCVAGGSAWFARRTGLLSDAERASGTVLAPLEASDPDALEKLIREQEP